MPASRSIQTASLQTLTLPVLHTRSAIHSSNQAELSAIKERTNTPVFAKTSSSHKLPPTQVYSTYKSCNHLDMVPPAKISHNMSLSQFLKPLKYIDQNSLCA